MEIDPQKVTERIVSFISQQMDEFQREGAIMGMSGGIDSALVGTLAVKALGADKVLALLLPERDSSPDSKTDALKVIRKLGIQYREVQITGALSEIGIYKLMPLQVLGVRHVKEAVVKQYHRRQAEALGEMPFQAGLLGTINAGDQRDTLNAGNAYARVKHRMRMVYLYYYADLENRLVLGTTNKSESMTGFAVKWGDNVADIEPIVGLYKTQVRQLAAYLGVAQEIIDRAPSPDLIPGIVDEVALGIDYATLDQILVRLERGWKTERIVAECQVQPSQVARVVEMVRRSAHLRQLQPSTDLSGLL
jgi:NAD+ synthase